jgi:hypothetical protein
MLMVDALYANMGILRNSMLAYEANLMLKHVDELGFVEGEEWQDATYYYAAMGEYNELIFNKYPDERFFEQSMYMLRPHLINNYYNKDTLTTFCAHLNLLLEYFRFAPRQRTDNMKLITSRLIQTRNRQMDSNAAMVWVEKRAYKKNK